MPSLMTISFSFSQFLEQKIMSTTKTKDRAATLIDQFWQIPLITIF